MFGEVFICQFPFTSGATSKLRPALVLFDLQDDAIICRITSAIRTGLLDVALKDWRTAGLLKPSVARLDRRSPFALKSAHCHGSVIENFSLRSQSCSNRAWVASQRLLCQMDRNLPELCNG